MTKIGKTGTGPWVITAEGTVELDATEKSVIGFQFYVNDANNTTTYGYTNTPNSPTPGGGPVSWSASSAEVKKAGAYTATFVMSYQNAGGMTKTILSDGTINLP